MASSAVLAIAKAIQISRDIVFSCYLELVVRAYQPQNASPIKTRLAARIIVPLWVEPCVAMVFKGLKITIKGIDNDGYIH